MLDCNSFIYEYCLCGARLIENIVVKPTGKWVCIIISNSYIIRGPYPLHLITSI